MRKLPWLMLTGLAGVAALSLAPRRAPAAEKPTAAAVEAGRQALVGEWKLNTELSDDPRAKMREARRGGGDRGWGGGGGRGGGGGWGGGRGGGGWGGGRGGGGWGGRRGGGAGEGGPRGAGAPDPSRTMLFSASQITVTNLTPELTILAPDGAIRRLHADGKSYKDDNGTEVKTRWDDSRLLVETKTQRGQIKETWAVTSDPRRLQVQLEIDRPFGDAVKIKRVFDAVDPNAPKVEGTKPAQPGQATQPAQPEQPQQPPAPPEQPQPKPPGPPGR
jgi:hypothetical protein